MFEITKIQDAVSEVTTGKMRMQFWHDTLDNVFKVLIKLIYKINLNITALFN